MRLVGASTSGSRKRPRHDEDLALGSTGPKSLREVFAWPHEAVADFIKCNKEHPKVTESLPATRMEFQKVARSCPPHLSEHYRQVAPQAEVRPTSDTLAVLGRILADPCQIGPHVG